MKKEILKIGIIFVVVIGLVVWGLNYIFFNQNAPKSKASGETMNLSFTPAAQTAAANTDFTVTILAKPSINTVLRGYKTRASFDKDKLSFKSIQYKVGVVSAGLGNTAADVSVVNTRGYIDIVGEDRTATGYSLTSVNGAELVSLTFTTLSTSGTSVLLSDSGFYSVNADMSLYDGWTSTLGNLAVNGGGVIPSSIPTTPTTTLTGTTSNVRLNLKLKFQGILTKPASNLNSMTVKATIIKEGETSGVGSTGTFTANESGIWSGTIGFNLTSVTGKYRILIKGPLHLQKKICDSVPSETSAGIYRCPDGNISLAIGDNSLNFSGIVLLVGDLDQNGIVDSVDFGLVKNNLGKTDPAILSKADLNRDGVVNTQDFSLILAALATRSDEQ